MKAFFRFFRRGLALLQKRRLEADMAEEMRLHLEHRIQQSIAAGTPANEARAAVLREFGGVEQIKERCRETRSWVSLERFGKDVRFGLRLLRRDPGFTATALLTLAVCLGANLTIFAVIDSVLLRPLPFPEAGRLVTIYNTYPKAGVDRDGSSLTNYYERRGNIAALVSTAIYREGSAIVGDTGATQRVDVLRVSADFFATLRLGPVLGRAFTEEETNPEADRVAILTNASWRQQFNADAGVIGREIRVNGVPRTIVGVLPAQFSFLSSRARLILPLSSRPADRAPNQRHSGGATTNLIARLAPGADIAQAQAEIDAHNAAMERGNPEARAMADAGFRSVVTSLHGDHVAAIRPTLLLLQTGALVLLVIGSVNLGNLLLIRSSGRARELALRRSLGASRRDVVIQVFTETLVLTALGGLGGLALGALGIRFLLAFGASQLPLGAQIVFDGNLALIAFAGAILLGLIIALPVAAFHLRSHPAEALQSGSRGGTAGRITQRMRHGFIVAQIALAFILLSGGALVGLSLRRAMAVAPGFRTDHVLTGQLSLPRKNYPGAPAYLDFTERFLAETRRLPGVISAGIISNVPLSMVSTKSAITIKDHVLPPGESPRGHYAYMVTGDYFATLGIPLREGRVLDADDSRRPELVCVVDEDFARLRWPRGGAIGQQVFIGSELSADTDVFTIVGIVGAVKQAEVTETQRQGAVYFPFGHVADDQMFVVVRTQTAAEAFGTALQEAVRRIDPELPVNDLLTMAERIDHSLLTRRSSALLIGLFSGIALLLTAVGTYGVLSYAVSQRRREIGVRIALGAQAGQIRSQFLGLGLRLIGAGTALGLMGAWLGGRAIESLLFEVPAFHPLTVIGTALVLGTVSLAACLIPARRAARIDPMLTLSAE